MDFIKDSKRAERRAEAAKHAARAQTVAEWKKANAAKYAASIQRFNDVAERVANFRKFEGEY
jgi:hypothetical protein